MSNQTTTNQFKTTTNLFKTAATIFWGAILAFCTCSPITAQTKSTTEPKISFSDATDGKLNISIQEKHFTTYDFKSQAKPFLYPVLGPQQLPMTRGFPIEEKPGEQHDHPHHKSIWKGHIINGVDFWTEKGGSIKHQKFVECDEDSFTVLNHWIKKNKREPMLSDETTFHFGGDKDGKYRWLDAKIKFIASHGDFTFDDTKEGLFAIRTHPAYRITPSKKQKPKLDSKPAARNSGGDTGKSIWGKQAKWVSYSGNVTNSAGKLQRGTILFFDHPSNFRHPTAWHARDYGLVAANPFGLHYFQKKPKSFGAHQIKNGNSITFRYRIVFHVEVGSAQKNSELELKPEFIDQLFSDFAASKF